MGKGPKIPAKTAKFPARISAKIARIATQISLKISLLGALEKRGKIPAKTIKFSAKIPGRELRRRLSREEQGIIILSLWEY